MTEVFELLTKPNFLITFVVMMLAVAGLFASLAKFTLAKRELDLKKYDLELRRATISDDRQFYESKMADLAERLAATEARWKDANHLVLSGTKENSSVGKPTNDSPFLSSFGITDEDRVVDSKLVFVLTPFGEEEYETFVRIKEICSDVGLQAVRGDETFTRGDILSHVVTLLSKSRIVIANISTRNANVYYELGIAHALSKPVILVSRSLNETPFDVKNQRIVVFRNEDELRDKLRTALTRAAMDPRNALNG